MESTIDNRQRTMPIQTIPTTEQVEKRIGFASVPITTNTIEPTWQRHKIKHMKTANASSAIIGLNTELKRTHNGATKSVPPQLNPLVMSIAKRSLWLLAMFMVMMQGAARGQAASATWALTANGNASVTGNVSATAIAIGTGVSSLTYTADGVNAIGWTTGSVFNASDYFQYTISPTSGNNITLTQIQFEHDKSNPSGGDGGPSTGAVFYSLNGFTSSAQIGSNFTINTSHSTFTSPTLSIAVSSGQTLTVRIYGWLAENANGRFSNRNVVFSGCSPAGDPAIFGTNTWNVYAYNGGNLDLTSTTYRGYYTESNLSFDTRNRWGAAASPSSAATPSNYQGCPVNTDNFTFVHKRQGFTCGTYQISVTGHDDDMRVYINETQVFDFPDYGTVHPNFWTGVLDANSKVEIRTLDGTGDSYAALTFVYSAPAADFSATSTSVVFGNSVTYTPSPEGATSWTWSFPGGTPSTSTDKNPVVTYNILGTHNVSLTENVCGSDLPVTKTGYTTVTVPPACGASTLFSQNFSSGTSLATYTGTGTNQFDGFNNGGGSNTISIVGNAIEFDRVTNGTTLSFTKSTDLSSPAPSAIIYKFDINVTSISNSSMTSNWQVGSGFSTSTNSLESNPYAGFSLTFPNTTTFRITGNNTNTFNVNTNYTITWVLNNSGSTFSYPAPDNSTESIVNDGLDLWVGTTRVLNDQTVTTASSTISDLKFVLAGRAGTILMDNFVITNPTALIPTVNTPSNQVKCAGTSTDAVSFTGTGATTFLWTNDNTNIGLAADGVGNIPSIITVNSGSTQQVATITVTPSNGTCAGTAKNFTITVNPPPTATIANIGEGSTNVSCYGGADGTVKVTANGGSGSGYEFWIVGTDLPGSWTSGANPHTYINL